METRRQFVYRMTYPAVSAILLPFLCSQCSPPEKNAESYQLKSCQDLSRVSERELNKRKQFAYETIASDPLKPCSTCKLYLPPKPEESCGGCSLFKGPVEAEGSCTYWAPLDA